jgi:hypothetical protein
VVEEEIPVSDDDHRNIIVVKVLSDESSARFTPLPIEPDSQSISKILHNDVIVTVSVKCSVRLYFHHGVK